MYKFALIVLVPVSFLVSCAKPGTDRQNFRFGTFTNTSDGTTREEVMLDPTDTIETCTAIDIDGDAVGDGVAECPDADGDLLTPATSASPWGDAACHCLVDGYDLVGYIVETSTAELDADFDCLDTDASIGPTVTYYADVDTDTYGDPLNSTESCAVPSGYVLDSADCDDTNIDVNPGEVEIVSNGLDDDCNAATLDDPDGDSDGYPISTDCNDADSAINPGATEIVLDGVSNDCSGVPTATATVTFCLTPVDGLLTTPWQLWVRDGTVDPDGTTTSTWASPGANQGSGTLCADVAVINGDIEYFNGPFDTNLNGVYGEVYDPFTGLGDGAWGYMNVTNINGVTGNGSIISVPRAEYDSVTGASDGHWTVNLM